jgi:hypothetical protein
MAIIKGAANEPISSAQVTGFGTTTSVLEREVGSSIFYMDPNSTPFTLLTDRAGSETTNEVKYEWYEKSLRPRSTQVNNGGGYTAGDTTFTVDSGLVAKVNDLIFVPRTGEVARVTASTSTTVTVDNRGLGASSAAALVDNDDLWVIGSTWKEGADVGVPDEWQEDHKYSYTQTFRTPFGASRRREGSASYTGQTRARVRGEQMVTHALDIERAFMFGVKAEVVSGNDIFTTTDGFTSVVTGNALDLLGSSLSEPDLEGWMEDLFEFTAGGDSRTVMASPAVITAFDQLGTDKLRLVPSDKMYGISVKQYMTSHGTLNIVKHRLLVDGPGGAGYGDWAFGVDVKQLKARPFAGGTTKLLPNRQGNGVDGWIDELLTDIGVQIKGAELHGTMRNVGVAA